jgi:V/A-type H+-transporting ATPase subunit K
LEQGDEMKIKVMLFLGTLLLPALAFAEEAGGAAASGFGLGKGLIAIGMGLAVGLGALGTGVAQARIGAAGLGSAVEKPETLGLALIFFLLPETLVIFGLVIAFILLGHM